eukprot:CAMPEP_0113472584 /NCGR_PEP_ID=MMETSP0014_2-20120614/17592_1 /TAXON_ID=2857 /ORGANISM="Nitzschia sp." /LENGTH=340 /DNA_ID=CAMNT_0000365301 /DNA_START=47 /DNA_END=1069 /DNA_ORIENTATION=- /assembly_acc=CAM_ASM_000159
MSLLSPSICHSKSSARAARAATARARQHSTAASAAAGTQWPIGGLVFGPSNNNISNNDDDDTNNDSKFTNRNVGVVGNFISIPKSAATEEGVVGRNNNNNNNRIDRQRFQHDYHYHHPYQQSPLSLSSSSSAAGLNPYYSLQHYHQNAAIAVPGNGNSESRRSIGGSIRHYSTTQPSERAVAIVMGLASVSALAYAGSSAVQSYQEWKDAQPTEEERAEAAKKAAEEEEARLNQQADEEKEARNSTQTNAEEQDAGPRENIFKQWFDVGTKYYEGGFEETMTKREAALILGVRESSSPQRIKDAHRKLLILNHPDTGGSTYLSGKLNEAKELLLKGKSSM